MSNYTAGPLGDGKVRGWLILGPLSCLRLYIQGRRDGRRGFSLDSKDWSNSAPFIERERLREQQFAADRRLRMEAETAKARIELEFSEKQLQRLKSELEQAHAELAEQEAGLTESMLTRRGPGEQDIPEAVIKTRRAREYGRRSAPLRERIERITDELSTLKTTLIRLTAQIDEAEKHTERLLERQALRTELRIAAYNQAVFNRSARGARGARGAQATRTTQTQGAPRTQAQAQGAQRTQAQGARSTRSTQTARPQTKAPRVTPVTREANNGSAS